METVNKKSQFVFLQQDQVTTSGPTGTGKPAEYGTEQGGYGCGTLGSYSVE